MVLLVYCRKRNKLRPPELMTVNLAVCDLGFSLLGVPFFVTSRYRGPGGGWFGSENADLCPPPL